MHGKKIQWQIHLEQKKSSYRCIYGDAFRRRISLTLR